MKSPIVLLLAAVLSISANLVQAEDDHAYTEGPVMTVSFIRTEPGKFDEYVRYLSNTYKKVMEEYKKQGIIMDYAVYNAVPRNPQDPDLILTITYKNMAALDDLQARTDPIDKKVWGSLSQADAAMAERGKLRTDMGSQLVRQLFLK
jgi:hypothetical protein